MGQAHPITSVYSVDNKRAAKNWQTTLCRMSELQNREREKPAYMLSTYVTNSSPSTLSSPMINSTHLSDCKSQQSQVNCTCNSEVNNQSQTYNHHTPVGLPLAVIDNHLNTILADGNAHPRFKSLSKTLILKLV
ncbi:hypothetical protein GJ496_002541 [Pomphorhynchus laevis]|nr:hypothetical protein GJ496_005945 [Pomphorhynchus laevis]KAI0987165.1 hypothetical protein GJ496_002541 [Pomphorhynchus laevis]